MGQVSYSKYAVTFCGEVIAFILQFYLDVKNLDVKKSVALVAKAFVCNYVIVVAHLGYT